MAKELNCDFYISADDPHMGIAKYDYSQLLNFKGELTTEKKVVGNFTWIGGMTRLFFKPYDIFVIGGPYNLNGWIMLFLSKFSRKQIASWSHGFYGRERGLRKLIKKLFFKLCNINFIYNIRSGQLMKDAGVNANSIVSVGNALDTDKELRIRHELKKNNTYQQIFGNDNPVIIFVGRVIEDKRLDQVIEAMCILKAKGENINFFVIGKDVDGVNLAEKAKNASLTDQVYLYGPCYDEDVVAHFFYNADVCVSPGPIGLTATNAMTYGCPVVSHDNFNYQGPEFEAIIPGETGDFFKENNVKELADKIVKWTTITSAEREIIRKNCFKEVDRFWNIYSETCAFKNALE